MKPAEAYILNQEEPFKSILLHLQLIIEQNFPEVILEFKWKIPFYYLDGNPFCYLNPSKKKKYVDVGFYATQEFDKYNELLISEGRKKVKSLRFSSVEEINSEILVSVLAEADEKKEKGFWKKN
ncbi:DUF1801 domain-containing protein [Tenacibaculum jejuense]|uniref:YdhG-like domain-containing protein n=1 Tax=Tenacibaculum jejuense TaxID=584609 RepID=A0A238UDP8_9FLAO|nr:DUF1801 domain-containing protein [Tenacibaculum jejuense]SNR16708.1 conserved protein of unknown function [Tenacibaculum jejuense]